MIDLGRRDCCDGFPDISEDGLELYVCSDRAGGFGGNDIWMASRQARTSPFLSPTNLGATVNSPSDDCEPGVSKDGLLLFFASDRKGGKGGLDLWIARRTGRSRRFGTTVNLGIAVNSGFSDERPDVSGDGTILYFMSDRTGGFGSFDLWQTKRI